MVESAGLLLYRRPPLEVLIAHPGGPLWRSKQEGAWSIPKGIAEPGECLLDAARREFAEETGLTLPGDVDFVELGSVRLRSGKRVTAFAVAADLDVAAARFGTFTMQWPPRSGQMQEFPEVDELRWVGRDEAAALLNPAQVAFVDRLAERLAAG